MKAPLFVLLSALLPPLALALTPEEAESRLVLVTHDQATQDASGMASDGRLARKPFANLLKELREAGVSAVMLDFVYEKRPVIQEENNALAEEFKKYNQPGAPYLEACNPHTIGLEGNVEDFTASAKLGICGNSGAEEEEVAGRNKQNSLVASYCRPVENDFGTMTLGFVSADPADATFSENEKCRPEDRDPVANLFAAIGLKIDLSRYAKTNLIEDGASIGKGLDVAYLEHAPVEISMLDILNHKIAPEQLKGKVVIVGTTVPGRDVVRLQGKEQHGVYSYVFTYLALLNDKYRNMARDEVRKVLP